VIKHLDAYETDEHDGVIASFNGSALEAAYWPSPQMGVKLNVRRQPITDYSGDSDTSPPFRFSPSADLLVLPPPEAVYNVSRGPQKSTMNREESND
jgi:hypothetical protein